MRNSLIAFLKKVLGHQTYLEVRNAWLFGRHDDPVMLQELPEVSVKWLPSAGAPTGPVFLISPTQRSGSNFLHTILSLHPDIIAVADKEGMPHEFFFHTYADAIISYAERTAATALNWLDQDALDRYASRMLASAGKGMLEGLVPEKDDRDRLLMRAPDGHRLENLFHLFPDATVILLFRDGRDTAASFHDSWGSDSVFSDFCKRWADRVKEMLEFEDRAAREGFAKQVIRIYYEDFLKNPEEPVHALLERAGLDPKRYPTGKLASVPVVGSSREAHVDWEPRPKGPDFNPSGRWHNWSGRRKETFQRLAGDMLAKLDYTR